MSATAAEGGESVCWRRGGFDRYVVLFGAASTFAGILSVSWIMMTAFTPLSRNVTQVAAIAIFALIACFLTFLIVVFIALVFICVAGPGRRDFVLRCTAHGIDVRHILSTFHVPWADITAITLRQGYVPRFGLVGELVLTLAMTTETYRTASGSELRLRALGARIPLARNCANSAVLRVNLMPIDDPDEEVLATVRRFRERYGPGSGDGACDA